MKDSHQGMKIDSPLDVYSTFTNNQILIARRREGKALAGYLEFPGGKVDEGESQEVALIREIYEEMGLHITVGSFVKESEYNYAFGTHTFACIWLLDYRRDTG